MQQQFTETDAFHFGTQATERLLNECNRVVAHERERRILINGSQTVQARARLKLLDDERERLRAVLQNTPRNGDNSCRRVYFVVIALILSITGLVLAHLAFSPFGFGWYAWPFSIGLPLVCAYSMDAFLTRCGSVTTIRMFALAAVISSITAMVGLGLLRGEILGQLVRTTLGEAGLEGAVSHAAVASFYNQASRELRVFFGLMAFAIEVATGLAMWEAARAFSSPEISLQKRLTAINDEMPILVGQIAFLEAEADIFAHQFRRDYFRGLIHSFQEHGVRWGGQCMLGLCFFIFGATSGWSQLHFVGAIDMSQSSDGAQYQRNLRAAAELPLHMPPGSRIDVIGITDKSFSNPVILFANRLPSDPGPLQLIDRIALARERFVSEIRKAGASITPAAAHTDIFGAIAFAQQLFEGDGSSTRYLIFLSDMRQSMKPLDIERGKTVPVAEALRTVAVNHLGSTLQGVNVYVLGAHAQDKDVVYWRALRDFWSTYFSQSGASLRQFSMTREIVLPFATVNHR